MGQWQWAKVRRVHTANVIKKKPSHTLGLFNFRLLLFSIRSKHSKFIFNNLFKKCEIVHNFHGIDYKMISEWNTRMAEICFAHAIEIINFPKNLTIFKLKFLSTVRKSSFIVNWLNFSDISLFSIISTNSGWPRCCIDVYITYVCVYHMKIEFGPVILFLSIS